MRYQGTKLNDRKCHAKTRIHSVMLRCHPLRIHVPGTPLVWQSLLVAPKQAMLHNVFCIKMMSTNLSSLCCARVISGCTTHIQSQASALHGQHGIDVGAVAHSHFSDDSAKIATCDDGVALEIKVYFTGYTHDNNGIVMLATMCRSRPT